MATSFELLAAMASGCHHSDIHLDPVQVVGENAFELPSAACSDGHVLLVSTTDGLFPAGLSRGAGTTGSFDPSECYGPRHYALALVSMGFE